MSNPPTYHQLSRSERDFLVAIAQTPADTTGQGLIDAVESLRGGDERPAHNTTYTMLPRLVEHGYAKKIKAERNASHYQLTEQGYEVLRDAATKLTP